jgi:ABC-type transporter Mla MlaB component
MNAAPRSTATEVLQAPIQLVSETRAAFRSEALAYVERLGAAKASVATVNLGETLEVDASGLGILVLLQKRAKELGMTLRLAQVPSKVRYLLVLTKLDHLFDMAD